MKNVVTLRRRLSLAVFFSITSLYGRIDLSRVIRIHIKLNIIAVKEYKWNMIKEYKHFIDFCTEHTHRTSIKLIPQ